MKIVEPHYTIESPIDPDWIYKHIEKIARKCYQSECKITEGSAEPFVRKITQVKKHESVIEHAGISVTFVVDRGVSHEVVRHRLIAVSQESTRYCVAGGTRLHFKSPHSPCRTVSELYALSQSHPNAAWKRMSIRTYNVASGELVYGKIGGVFCVGRKPVVKVKTHLGYEIILTADHRILSGPGGEFTRAGDLVPGFSMIGVNGTDALYLNKDWLAHQYNDLQKTAPQIARECGVSCSAIKSWVRRHGLPRKPKSYWKRGTVPWNKGLGEGDPRVKIQADALRKYHWTGPGKSPLPRRDRVMLMSESTYHKFVGEKCEICGDRHKFLIVHHIDENRDNNQIPNLMTLCPSCHSGLHNRSLQTVMFDLVTSVEACGEEDVFDVSMVGDNKNFVADGIVVHNCNYSDDRFGNEVSFVRPHHCIDGTREFYQWARICEQAETNYLELVRGGWKAEDARGALPHWTKTELTVTANMREWRHIFKMRTAEAAHPDMRWVMRPLLAELKRTLPAIFGDL